MRAKPAHNTSSILNKIAYLDFGETSLDFSRAVPIVCVALFLVVGINAFLFVSLSRKNNVGQIELMRRAAKRARDPWEQETNDLQELSRIVAELKNKKSEDADEKH